MEAAEMQENDLTAPIYLKKAGLCAEALNNFDIASTNYKTIMDNYADFARENQIERYYARANNKTTK
jgi:phosphotransacetylase